METAAKTRLISETIKNKLLKIKKSEFIFQQDLIFFNFLNIFDIPNFIITQFSQIMKKQFILTTKIKNFSFNFQNLLI